MKTSNLKLLAFPLIGLLLAGCVDGGEPKETELDLTYSNLENAKMYQKAEIGVRLELDEETNPYDASDINVNALIVAPSGKQSIVPMFYYVPYESRYVGSREELYKAGEGDFRLRFTPREAGLHQYQLSVVQNGVSVKYPSTGYKTFEVDYGTKDAFLRVASDNKTLVYDNGGSFVGIGNNFCGWEWAGVDNMAGTYDYQRWFTKLSENGGNMTQFDLCEGDQIEWTYKENELEWSSEYQGLGRYNQKAAFKTDYKVSLADQLGLFYRFSLFHWEDFDKESDSFPDWGWARNPYNSKNGGPSDDVNDFFSNPKAKAHTKNYLRYIVARYGYSTNLMMYELFNEVDAPDMEWGLGESYGSTIRAITEWHDEMAKYIKSLDSYDHMVTTSCASSSAGGEYWALDSLDLTTFHRYTMYNGGGNEPQFETVKSLNTIINNRLNTTNKPTIPGEFAISPGGDIQREFDREGVAFHNALYASILSGSLGTAMSWTWGSYVDEYDLYHHYKGASELFEGANLNGATAFNNLSTEAATGHSWYMGLRKGDCAYLWIKDSMHDYRYTKDGYKPMAMEAGLVNVPGLAAGAYNLEYIDTYTGEVFDVREIEATSGSLAVPYESYEKDIAVKIIGNASYYKSENIYSGSDGDGHVPHASYTKQNAEKLTVYASGYDIGGTSDAGRFAYIPVSGDFSYSLRLDKSNYSANGAKAGLMVRESALTSSKMAFVGTNNNAQFFALSRTKSGTPAAFENYGNASLGTYLKAVRSGNNLTVSVSLDGISYTEVKSTTYESLSNELLVGVMAANKNTLGYNKAIFSHMKLERN